MEDAAEQRLSSPRMEVVYVPADEHVDRDEGLEIAGRWLRSQAKSSSRPRPVIVVPVRDSIGHSPVLQRLAGEYEWATALTIHDVTTFRNAVLACWPSRKTLARIQDAHPRAVCVCEWREEETADWLVAHNARDLTGRGPMRASEMPDAIVQVALEDLTRSVNLHTNLVQTDDHEHAILMLRLLIRHDHRIDSDALYRWAIANRWPGRGAAKLKQLAEEVLAGRRHVIRERRPFSDDTYEWWKKEAAAKP